MRARPTWATACIGRAPSDERLPTTCPATSRRRSRIALLRATSVIRNGLGVGAATAGRGIVRGDLGFDIAAQRAMLQHAPLDLRKVSGVSVKPVKVTVEHESRGKGLLRSHVLDRIQRQRVAVQPADDVQHVGGDVGRPREHSWRVTVRWRAGPPRAVGAPAPALSQARLRSSNPVPPCSHNSDRRRQSDCPPGPFRANRSGASVRAPAFPAHRLRAVACRASD